MCTMNLHTIVQHSKWQEDQTGALAATSEYWVERMIGVMKAKTKKGGLTWNPEKMICNDLLVRKALQDRAREFPHLAHLVGLGEQEEPSEFKGPSDQLDEGSGQQLLHVGREVELGKLTETEVTSLRIVALNDNRRDPLDLGQCRLYEFTAARVRKEIVQSKAHTRTVSRESYHVRLKVVLTKEGAEKIVNADVLRFLKVLDEERGRCFRAAQVDLYKTYKDLGSEVELVEKTNFYRRGVFVPLGCLLRKVMFADDLADARRMFVLPCSTLR